MTSTTHPFTGLQVSSTTYAAISTQALIAEHDALVAASGLEDFEIAPVVTRFVRAMVSDALAQRLAAGDPVALEWDMQDPDELAAAARPAPEGLVIGPTTRRIYPAFVVGDWNGAQVLGFRRGDLAAMVTAGDGQDGNGDGLAIRDDGVIVDVCQTATIVPTVTALVDGEPVTLYVPQGRAWDATLTSLSVPELLDAVDGPHWHRVVDELLDHMTLDQARAYNDALAAGPFETAADEQAALRRILA